MRLILSLLCLAAPRAFGAIQMRQLFWDAHGRHFALVLIDTDQSVRIFLGRRPLLHQVEVSEPAWFEERTELRAKLGTGQIVTMRNIDSVPVMYTQEPAVLSLLYAEAMAKERAGQLTAEEIPQYVRLQSFRETERWLRVELDERRLRREFQLIGHPLREVDLDFIESCEQTIVPLNDNRPGRRR